MEMRAWNVKDMPRQSIELEKALNAVHKADTVDSGKLEIAKKDSSGNASDCVIDETTVEDGDETSTLVVDVVRDQRQKLDDHSLDNFQDRLEKIRQSLASAEMESSARLQSIRRQTSQEQEKLLMDSQCSESYSLGMTAAEKMTSPSHLEFTSAGHTISKEYQEELRKEEEQFWNRARDMPR